MTPTDPPVPDCAVTRRWLAAVRAAASTAAGARVARVWLAPSGKPGLLLCHGAAADGREAAVVVSAALPPALDGAGEYGRRLGYVLALVRSDTAPA